MGKRWDATGIAFDPATWSAALRVAKPGAHLLAFGGTRTYHRLASAIEDAGWDIRDTLVWAYAQGFPKSLDVSKAIDKAAGAKRERIRGVRSGVVGSTYAQDPWSLANKDSVLSSEPLTDDAERWRGWGTALKPAWEPIVLARKPLDGTVAANVLEHGTAALNIDGNRIGSPRTEAEIARSGASTGGYSNLGAGVDWTRDGGPAGGRWPSNVVLTDPVFDGDTDGVVGGGETSSGLMRAGTQRAGKVDTTVLGEFRGVATSHDTPGDTGTYSRFFLIPKASRTERDRGLDGDERPLLWSSGTTSPGTFQSANTRRSARNHHPTVKPIELMRHLVRLVTPSGGIVLDPFLGSGTTAIACELEGFDWIGIEREPDYVALARERIAAYGTPAEATA